MSSDGEFGDFVTARHHALLRTAVLLTGSQHAGEDLLQETLAKTYVVWDRIRRKGAAEAYVRRVLVNTYTSWWRRHRGRERSVASPPEVQVADGATTVLDRVVLRPNLLALSRRQRTVLVLRFYEGMTEPEIAAVLGCPVGTVKSHSSRALAILRRRLAEEGVTDVQQAGADPDTVGPVPGLDETADLTPGTPQGAPL